MDVLTCQDQVSSWRNLSLLETCNRDDRKWPKSKRGTGKFYNPKTDRLETGDAAADNPDVTAKMHVTFNSWTDEVGAHADLYSNNKHNEKLKWYR